jgi:hypothetical protein
MTELEPALSTVSLPDRVGYVIHTEKVQSNASSGEVVGIIHGGHPPGYNQAFQYKLAPERNLMKGPSTNVFLFFPIPRLFQGFRTERGPKCRGRIICHM